MAIPFRFRSRRVGNSTVTCKVRRGASRQSGKFTEYVYEGSEEAIYGMVGEIEAASDWDSWDIDHTDNKFTLKVRYADNRDDTQQEEIVDEVRLHAGVYHDDLKKLPQFSTLSRDDRNNIEAAIQDPASAQIYITGMSTTALTLYHMFICGHNSIQRFRPILERRRLASATFNFGSIMGSAFDDVGSVISPANIRADAGLNDDFLKFSLPAGGQVIITDTNPAPPVLPSLVLNYGWLKGYPQYDYSAGNKAIVSQQWEFGLYPEASYGVLV